MYNFYTYVSVYQILCSGRFRWEQCSHHKKEMSFHRATLRLGGTKSPHKFAHFFLFGVLTTFSFCVSSQVSIPKKGEKTAVLSRHALVVLGKLLFICFAIQLFLLSSKKNNQIILVISVCKDDFDWLHSRQNNYIFRHSVCIKKRTYFVRFSFYLCLFFVISYFPLLQLL